MKDIAKSGWLIQGTGWPADDAIGDKKTGEKRSMDMKTVMVYRTDGKTTAKEPLGILVERRRAERGENIVGMLRLARMEFAGTDDGSGGIVIGDYVTADRVHGHEESVAWRDSLFLRKSND